MSALNFRVRMLEVAVRRLQAEREADEKVKRYRFGEGGAGGSGVYAPDVVRRPTPLRDTCRCGERTSRYKASTGEQVPLSYRSRHLMQDLREAATEAVQGGYYTPELSAARLALAQRLSELETALASRHSARCTCNDGPYSAPKLSEHWSDCPLWVRP